MGEQYLAEAFVIVVGQDDYFDDSDVISTILCVMIDHQNLNM